MSAWRSTAFDEYGSPCGTAHCIGGWIGFFTDTKPYDPRNQALVYRAAARLPNTRLFFERDWPEHLRDEYKDNWFFAEARASVAARAIDSYIETNGWARIGRWSSRVEDV